MGFRKWSSGHVGPPFRAVKLFSRSGGATIDQEPWLESRRGLSHESAQEGCNGTCVKLEALKPVLRGNMVRLGHP